MNRSSKAIPDWAIEPYGRDSFLVRSMTNREESYVVDLEEHICTCKDFEYRGKGLVGYRCKHIEAIYLRRTQDRKLAFYTDTGEQIDAARAALLRLQRFNLGKRPKAEANTPSREEIALGEVIIRLLLAAQEEDATGAPLPADMGTLQDPPPAPQLPLKLQDIPE